MPETSELVELLTRAPPFIYMSRDDVAAFARAGKPVDFEPGEIVFSEKQDASSVLVVLSGTVYICTFESEGRQVIEAVMAPFESFGWLSVADENPRSISASVRGKASLLVIPRRDVLAVLERAPHAWQAVARHLAERLRRTLASQRALAGFPLERRIAFILCQAFRIGVTGSTPLTDLDLSQEDVASMTASSRQSVNKQLKALERAGLIEVRYNALRVVEPDVLLELALGEHTV